MSLRPWLASLLYVIRSTFDESLSLRSESLRQQGTDSFEFIIAALKGRSSTTSAEGPQTVRGQFFAYVQRQGLF
jgi:hypothetical protein